MDALLSGKMLTASQVGAASPLLLWGSCFRKFGPYLHHFILTVQTEARFASWRKTKENRGAIMVLSALTGAGLGFSTTALGVCHFYTTPVIRSFLQPRIINWYSCCHSSKQNSVKHVVKEKKNKKSKFTPKTLLLLPRLTQLLIGRWYIWHLLWLISIFNQHRLHMLWVTKSRAVGISAIWW